MIETIGKANTEREELDFYATDPKAVKTLIKKENIKGLYVLENSAGNGHIAKVLRDEGNKVFTIDVIERDFELNKTCDFLKLSSDGYSFDCAIYNPPFKFITEFILHTFKFTNIQYVFARVQILESMNRYNKLYKNNWLEKVMVFSGRMTTAKGGDDSLFGKNNSMLFGWFKFNKNNINKTILEWI